MQQILDPNGPYLPIIVAMGLAVFAWIMRSQGAPAASTDPFEQLGQSMLALSKSRQDTAQKEAFKVAAAKAVEEIMPDDPTPPVKGK